MCIYQVLDVSQGLSVHQHAAQPLWVPSIGPKQPSKPEPTPPKQSNAQSNPSPDSISNNDSNGDSVNTAGLAEFELIVTCWETDQRRLGMIYYSSRPSKLLLLSIFPPKPSKNSKEVDKDKHYDVKIRSLTSHERDQAAQLPR